MSAPEIQFYHLRNTALETALPRLMEKALGGGFQVAILVKDAAQMKKLDEQLWTYDAGSFLPHGTEKDAHADDQPVLLATRWPEKVRSLAVIADGRTIEQFPDGVTRVLDMFDGTDETLVQEARQRWQHYKTAGYGLTYIRQQDDGSWKKEMEQAAAS